MREDSSEHLVVWVGLALSAPVLLTVLSGNLGVAEAGIRVLAALAFSFAAVVGVGALAAGYRRSAEGAGPDTHDGGGGQDERAGADVARG